MQEKPFIFAFSLTSDIQASHFPMMLEIGSE